MTTTATVARLLYVIASDIRKHWPKAYFGAKPYLDAMSDLTGITDRYICDDGRSIVLYFLANANTWRGDDARRIKAELRGMLMAAMKCGQLTVSVRDEKEK